MDKTDNLGYEMTVAPKPVRNYNDNLLRIDTDIAARGVHPVAVECEGETHNLVFAGAFDTVKFTAESDFVPGATLLVNGEAVPLQTAEGGAYTVAAWKAGDAVVLAVQAESVRVLAPAHNKAEVGRPEVHLVEFVPEYTNRYDVNVNPSIYYKTADGRVTVEFDAWRVDGAKINGTNRLLALPEGYRPVAIKSQALQIGGGFWVDAEGILRFNAFTNALSYVAGQISYLAAEG